MFLLSVMGRKRPQSQASKKPAKQPKKGLPCQGVSGQTAAASSRPRRLTAKQALELIQNLNDTDSGSELSDEETEKESAGSDSEFAISSSSDESSAVEEENTNSAPEPVAGMYNFIILYFHFVHIGEDNWPFSFVSLVLVSQIFI